MFSTHLFGEPVIIASGMEDVKHGGMEDVKQSEGRLFQPAYPAELTGNTVPLLFTGSNGRLGDSSPCRKSASCPQGPHQEIALNTLSTWEGRRVLVGEEARSVSHEDLENFPKHSDIQLV